MFTDTDQAVLVIIVCLPTIAILFLCKQYYTLVVLCQAALYWHHQYMVAEHDMESR